MQTEWTMKCINAIYRRQRHWKVMKVNRSKKKWTIECTNLCSIWEYIDVPIIDRFYWRNRRHGSILSVLLRKTKLFQWVTLEGSELPKFILPIQRWWTRFCCFDCILLQFIKIIEFGEKHQQKFRQVKYLNQKLDRFKPQKLNKISQTCKDRFSIYEPSLSYSGLVLSPRINVFILLIFEVSIGICYRI